MPRTCASLAHHSRASAAPTTKAHTLLPMILAVIPHYASTCETRRASCSTCRATWLDSPLLFTGMTCAASHRDGQVNNPCQLHSQRSSGHHLAETVRKVQPDAQGRLPSLLIQRTNVLLLQNRQAHNVTHPRHNGRDHPVPSSTRRIARPLEWCRLDLMCWCR